MFLKIVKDGLYKKLRCVYFKLIEKPGMTQTDILYNGSLV